MERSDEKEMKMRWKKDVIIREKMR